MTNLHNTLYVTTEGAYLRKDHENVSVRIERKTALEVPLHHLQGIVCLGRVSVSPSLLRRCGEAGIPVAFLSPTGRFYARVEGPMSGSALLRRRQYRASEDPPTAAALARGFVAGKIANSRLLLQRAARETESQEDRGPLEAAAHSLENSLRALANASAVEGIRGHEGEAAATYFSVFDHLLRRHRDAFHLERRTRRPPMDRINALLSFLYALLSQDATSALQSVGFDPAVGYLHADRPGRPSLALDLVEEFRPLLADRLAVSLINLGQAVPEAFTKGPTGAVSMSDALRKAVIVAYQRRKSEEITHPFTGEKATYGLAMHVQARLLARVIRGDLGAYPPLVLR